MAKQNKGRKFFAASATAALVASAIVPVASAAQVNDYNKISGYAKEAVQSLVDAGVIQGDTNGNFNPLNTVTRAQAAEIFTKALELEADGDVNFSDVKKGAWYYNSIAAVVANGIFEGVSANEFAPNKSLTRSEAAKVLVDAFGLEGSESLSQFADASQVKGWAKDALETAVANGIFTGSEENGKLNLKPNAAITRQDFAVVFARTLELVDTETPVDASIKAINNTTVEVTFDEEVNVDDVKAGNFKIDGLEVKNASVKQTNKKVVVLTTEAQTADKEYILTHNDVELGKFKGVAAVIPTKINVTTSSLQGIIGKEVTLKAQVTVAEGQSKANIPVTFNIVSDNTNINAKIEVEALTDENGVATYSYTRYYSHNDHVAAYATNKASVVSNGKVYWADKTQLSVSELTTGNELANETKKSYKVTSAKPNTTYYVAIKENLQVTPDKVTQVKVQSHATQDFVTPYELTTGGKSYATVTTNSNGEGSFTIHGSNLEATPIVYLPSSVNSDAKDFSYSALALQDQAPTVKFSKVDRLDVKVVGEGTADSAEFYGSTAPVAYNANSAGGRTYTVTVTDKEGKIAPAGTVAYVAFADLVGDVYFTTDKQNFKKVTKGDIQQLTVGKDGKVQFRVAGKGATTYVKPTVFLNTAGDVSPVKLDTADIQAVGEITYFKSPVVSNAALTVRDELGNEITSQVANKDVYFTYQSVDQNGFDYRPGNYTVTPGSTTIIYVQKTDPVTGVVTFVPQEIKNPAITLNTYDLAFDVTSTFGNATVKDLSGNVLNATQNMGNSKTYKVASNQDGKAVVRVTSNNADTVSVNVTGASNILPTKAATVTFTADSGLPTVVTNATVQWANITDNTFKLVPYAKVIDYTNADLYVDNLILGVGATGNHTKVNISQFEQYISSNDVVTVLTDANGKYSIYLNTNNAGTNNGPVVTLGKTGTVALNKASYAKGENITITVTDADFAANGASNDTLNVIVKNGSLAMPVTVNETATAGEFTATLSAPVINSLVAGTITVEYTDALDAAGSTNVIRTATATQTAVTGALSVATLTTPYAPATPTAAKVIGGAFVKPLNTDVLAIAVDGASAVNVAFDGTLNTIIEVRDFINSFNGLAGVAKVENGVLVLESPTKGTSSSISVTATGTTPAGISTTALTNGTTGTETKAVYSFGVTTSPVVGETVTVGSKTYTVVTTGAVAGQVNYDASATTFATNLRNAITRDDAANWTVGGAATTITLTQATAAAGSTAPTVTVK